MKEDCKCTERGQKEDNIEDDGYFLLTNHLVSVSAVTSCGDMNPA